MTVAGLGAGSVYKCSRGVLVSSDMTLDEALSKGPYDVVLLPGGPGHKDFSSVRILFSQMFLFACVRLRLEKINFIIMCIFLL